MTALDNQSSKALLDAMPVACAINDRAGNIVYLNTAFLRIFGYSLTEIRTVDEWWPLAYPDPDYRQKVIAAWNSALSAAIQNNQPMQPLEVSIRAKSSKTMTVLVSAANLEENDKGLLLVTLFDISERKEMEVQLATSQERLELALAGSAQGLWDVDICSGTSIYDERWCAMLGYRMNEIEGSVDAWKRLIHPEDLAYVDEQIVAHSNGETATYQAEYRIKHKEGHWVWVLSRGKIVARDAQNKPLRASGTQLDITSQKRLTNEGVQLVQRIEALMHEVSDWSGKRPLQANPPKAKATAHLSRRQLEILELIASGHKSAEIAEKLQIALVTVTTHRRDLMAKLDLHSVAELTRYAIKEGLICN